MTISIIKKEQKKGNGCNWLLFPPKRLVLSNGKVTDVTEKYITVAFERKDRIDLIKYLSDLSNEIYDQIHSNEFKTSQITEFSLLKKTPNIVTVRCNIYSRDFELPRFSDIVDIIAICKNVWESNGKRGFNLVIKELTNKSEG